VRLARAQRKAAVSWKQEPASLELSLTFITMLLVKVVIE